MTRITEMRRTTGITPAQINVTIQTGEGMQSQSVYLNMNIREAEEFQRQLAEEIRRWEHEHKG